MCVSSLLNASLCYLSLCVSFCLCVFHVVLSCEWEGFSRILCCAAAVQLINPSRARGARFGAWPLVSGCRAARRRIICWHLKKEPRLNGGDWLLQSPQLKEKGLLTDCFRGTHTIERHYTQTNKEWWLFLSVSLCLCVFICVCVCSFYMK